MLAPKIIEKFDKILIIGPIYDNSNIFEKIDKISNQYDFVILNGNISFPINENHIQNQIEHINTFKNIIYNIGDLDLKLIHLKQDDYKFNNIIKWLESKSNIVIAINQYKQKILIMSGGISPDMKESNLINNVEISFISNIDNQPWHKKYGGGFGYVISNNPLTSSYPVFYDFSTQIGNNFGKDNQIYGQEILKTGLGKTILF